MTKNLSISGLLALVLLGSSFCRGDDLGAPANASAAERKLALLFADEKAVQTAFRRFELSEQLASADQGNRFADAIELAKELLALTPDQEPAERYRLLGMLEEFLEATGKLAAAQDYANQARSFAEAAFPPADWRIVSARIAQTHLQTVAKLSAEQQQTLQRLHEELDGRNNRDAAAISKSLTALNQLLGGNDPDYVSALTHYRFQLFADAGPDRDAKRQAYERGLLAWSKRFYGEQHPAYARQLISMTEQPADDTVEASREVDGWALEASKILRQCEGLDKKLEDYTALPWRLRARAEKAAEKLDWDRAKTLREEVLKLETYLSGPASEATGEARMLLAKNEILRGQDQAALDRLRNLEREEETDIGFLVNNNGQEATAKKLEDITQTRRDLLGDKASFYDVERYHLLAELKQEIKERLKGPKPEGLDKEIADLREQAVAAAQARFGSPCKALLKYGQPAAASLQALAEKEAAARDWAKAIELQDRATAILSAAWGQDHWQSLDSQRVRQHYQRLADLADEKRDELLSAESELRKMPQRLYHYTYSRQSAQRLQAARATFNRILGPRSLPAGDAAQRLAQIWDDVGADERVPALLRDVVEIRRQVLGRLHPRYIDALRQLAFAQPPEADPQIAARLLQEAGYLCSLIQYDPDRREIAPGAGTTFNRSELNLDTELEIALTSKLAATLDQAGNLVEMNKISLTLVELCAAKYGIKDSRYAASLSDRANLFLQMGDLATAATLLRQARRIAEQAQPKDEGVLATILTNIAVVQERGGQDEAAQKLLEQATEMRAKAKGKQDRRYLEALANLAFVLHKLGQPDRAASIYQAVIQQLEATQANSQPEYMQILDNLGFVYLTQGKTAEAEKWLAAAWKLRSASLPAQHPDRGDSLHDLALLDLQKKEFASAWKKATAAAAIARHNLDAAVVIQSDRQQVAMAQALRRRIDLCLTVAVAGKLPVAALYEQVLPWKGALLGRRKELGAALAKDAKLRELLRQVDESSNYLSQDVLSPQQGTTNESWQAAVDAALKNQEAASVALNTQIVKSLATIARESSQSPLADLQRALPPGAALVDFVIYSPADWWPGPGDQKKDVRRLVAFVIRAEAAPELRDLGLLAPIAEGIEKWRTACVSHSTKATDAVGKQLRDLLWSPLAPLLAKADVILVCPDGPLGRLPFAALPGSQPDELLVEKYAISYTPSPKMVLTLFRAPAPKAETKAETNAVESPADLFPDPTGERRYPAERLSAEEQELLKTSLLVVGEVNYGAPAAAKGSGDKARSAEQKFGDLPLSRLRSWLPLANTRGEMLALRDSFEKNFADGPVRMLRDKRATEEAVRANVSLHRWVHLATHGFFVERLKQPGLLLDSEGVTRERAAGFHPGLSAGVVLAGANQPDASSSYDGLLTALEISALDLGRVELLTLSACETGLGAEAVGEGLQSVQRAAHLAGAKSVLASLWKVDDRVTREFMELFYANLWNQEKPMSKLEALRQAQLTLMKNPQTRGLLVLPDEAAKSERLPPHFWAAFVLSGDWR